MRVSIRALLSAIVLLFTVALGWVTVERASVSLAEYRSARRGETDNRTADLLLRAAGQWAVERGRTNAALNAAGAAAAGDLDAIRARRQDGDAALAAALARLGPAAEQAVADARTAVIGLRLRVDHALALPAAAREAGLAPATVAGLTALIERSQALRLAQMAAPTGTEARLAELQQIKHLAWVMSEFAGRERAAVGGLIAGGSAASPATLQQLAGFRGRVEAAWDVVAAYADRPDAPAAVRQAAGQVRDGFFGRFQALRSAVLAAASGGPYPIPAPAWIDAATEAINTILALNEALGSVTAAQAQAAADDSLRVTVIDGAVLLLALVLAGGSALAIALRVVAPLRHLATIVRRLAAGDTDIALAGADRADEIGAVTAAVAVFKANAIEKRRLEAEQAQAAARAAEERRAAARLMAEIVEREANAAMTAVSADADAMGQAAGAMGGSAVKVTESAAQVADAAGRAQAQAAAVSTAGEELSASIGAIAGQVATGRAVAQRAVALSQGASDQIRELAEAATQIGSVVGLIGSIAGQTNLLALNATIEAARAGAAGKGFAVVASEVKSLASQTAASAQDIVRQVSGIQDATRGAIAVIEAISRTIDDIAEVSAAITAAVDQQAQATAEIARNVTATSDTARDVAARIALIGEEADRTGKQAEAVRARATGVERGIVSLRDSIVRVVRTTTDDANRRGEPRYAASETCRLEWPGATVQPGRLLDISAHGAMVGLQGADGAPPVGARGTLRLDRGGDSVPVTVQGVTTDGRLHLMFRTEGVSPEFARMVADMIAAAPLAA